MIRRLALSNSRKANLGRAFTLVELLVIVAIIGILLASGVPAIRSMIYTSTGSLAESQLRFGLSAARSLAIRNASGDSAAVFTYEPGGRLSIVPMIWVGRVLDTANPDVELGATTPSAYRDVFVPTALAEPIQLPRGWMVRGFAPPYSIFGTNQRNNDNLVVPSNGWYFEQNAAGNRLMNAPGVGAGNAQDTISLTQNKGNWVFPETGFFDPDKDQSSATRPNSRSTFMIRFQSGTGRIVGASATPAIVLLPRGQIDWVQYPNSRAKLSSPNWSGPSDWRRVDRCDNLGAWAKAVAQNSSPVDAAALIGCRSTDAVLASTVNLISLYDESRMAAAIGARGVNKVTGTIYGGAVTGGGATGSTSVAGEVPKAPNIDLSLFSQTAPYPAATNSEVVQMLINNYMIGALRYSHVADGGANELIPSDARLFTFDTYLGTAQEAK